VHFHHLHCLLNDLLGIAVASNCVWYAILLGTDTVLVGYALVSRWWTWLDTVKKGISRNRNRIGLVLVPFENKIRETKIAFLTKEQGATCAQKSEPGARGMAVVVQSQLEANHLHSQHTSLLTMENPSMCTLPFRKLG